MSTNYHLMTLEQLEKIKSEVDQAYKVEKHAMERAFFWAGIDTDIKLKGVAVAERSLIEKYAPMPGYIKSMECPVDIPVLVGADFLEDIATNTRTRFLRYEVSAELMDCICLPDNPNPNPASPPAHIRDRYNHQGVITVGMAFIYPRPDINTMELEKPCKFAVYSSDKAGFEHQTITVTLDKEGNRKATVTNHLGQTYVTNGLGLGHIPLYLQKSQ